MIRSIGRFATSGLATLPVLLAAACGAAPSDSRTTLVRDSAGIIIVENGATAPRATWHLDPTPAFEFGGGASGPGSDLLHVSAAHRLPDGTVAIADIRSRIVVVDADGRLLHIATRNDPSLGGFRRVDWIQRTPDGQLAIFELIRHRISYLSASGELIGSALLQPLSKSEPVPPWLVGAFADGTLLSRQLLFGDTTGNPDPMRPNQLLQRHGSDGSALSRLGIVPGGEIIITSGNTLRSGPDTPDTPDTPTVPASSATNPAPPPQPTPRRFYRKTSIAVGAESYIVAPGDEFELFEYTQTGELRRLIRLAHRLVPVPPELMASTRRNSREEPRSEATYPAYERVRLDDAGNIWVEEFRLTDDAPVTWLIFDPAGQLLATLTMPDRFRPLQFGADFVLGVARDELGVEQVRVHRLLKG